MADEIKKDETKKESSFSKTQKNIAWIGSLVILLLIYLVARRFEVPDVKAAEVPAPASYTGITEDPLHGLHYGTNDVEVGTQWYDPTPDVPAFTHAYPKYGGVEWIMKVHFRTGTETNIPMYAVDDPRFHNVEYKDVVTRYKYCIRPGQGITHSTLRVVLAPR